LSGGGNQYGRIDEFSYKDGTLIQTGKTILREHSTFISDIHSTHSNIITCDWNGRICLVDSLNHRVLRVLVSDPKRMFTRVKIFKDHFLASFDDGLVEFNLGSISKDPKIPQPLSNLHELLNLADDEENELEPIPNESYFWQRFGVF
jgi:hypothetical protein